MSTENIIEKDHISHPTLRNLVKSVIAYGIPPPVSFKNVPLEFLVVLQSTPPKHVVPLDITAVSTLEFLYV